MKYFTSIFTIVFLSISIMGKAQVYSGDKAAQYHANASKVWYDSLSQSAKYIEYVASEQLSTSKKASADAMRLPGEVGLSKTKNNINKKGSGYTSHQLTYKNLPIEGAVVKQQYTNGKLKSSSGFHKYPKQVSTSPTISAKVATALARSEVPATQYIENKRNSVVQATELVILPVNNEFHLSFKVDVYAIQPVVARKFVYVDAHTGEILKMVDRIHNESHTGTAHTLYQGEQEIETNFDGTHYTLHDQSRNAEIITLNMERGYNFNAAQHFSDTDNIWEEDANLNNAATNAHYAFEAALDYYQSTFNLNSFDNEGATVTSYIHFGEGYNNAFWDGNSFIFGDGDGSKYSPLTSTDVVAHEFTHAVTEHTAGLEYLNESGALNESFSDIFGVAIDFYTNPSTANFLLGDEFSIAEEASRNMANPKQFNDPNTYKGEYWESGTMDNGGVHTNCGVQNYWFYLLAMGGNGTNDLGNTYTVQGIGLEKAAQIAFHNLTVYLTPYSQYADARFFSIQSAIDLFGACSEEVIVVTNAWYAVGVGQEFTNLAKANFHASRNYSCTTPAEVNFTNTSANASSYIWDFGDGNTSNEFNPTHIYTEEGNYTVSLKAEGENTCTSVDSISISNFITITNNGDITDAVCEPNTRYPGDHGIQSVALQNTVNNTGLSGSDGGYIDYSCNFNFNLIAGQTYDIEVITGPGKEENVALWIDLNNDGEFTISEQLWYSENQLKTHTGSLHIPAIEFYNVPLRMRIVSDKSVYSIDACKSLFAGQGEDYRVMISPNTVAPEAEFTLSSSVAGIGKNIQLIDESQHLPTTWHWIIPGGNPAISTEQNPVVSYDEAGTYNITLIAENEFGTDSITITKCIEILPSYNMSNEGNSTLREGILYDNGSHNGNYSNHAQHSFLIEPPCNQAITIDFISFATEETRDFVYIYDGQDAEATLLYSVSGHNIPKRITAQSGSVYIEFITDGTVTDAGFIIHWKAQSVENTLLTADFILSDTVITKGDAVQLFDNSGPAPSQWEWNLGDGKTAISEKVSHIYSTPGNYNIQLVASNCFYGDTITRVLQVIEPQPEPGAPIIIEEPNDIIQNLSDSEYLIDLNSVFSDPQESILYYNVFASNNDVASIQIQNGILHINPSSKGNTEMSVIAANEYGLSALVSFNVTVNAPSNTDGQSGLLELTVHPNPTTDYITVNCPNVSKGNAQIDIISVTGQLIASDIIQSNGSELQYTKDLTHLPNGRYQVVVRHNNIIKNINLIKH